VLYLMEFQGGVARAPLAQAAAGIFEPEIDKDAMSPNFPEDCTESSALAVHDSAETQNDDAEASDVCSACIQATSEAT
jgi:hypothetical protein